MPLRRIMVVALATAATAVAVSASGALAVISRAPSAQQTHPAVTPRVGHRHSNFQLTFTLAQSPRHTGLVQISYRSAVTAPTHAPRSCSPAQPPPITTGNQGSTTRVVLRPPAAGWCKGRYAVTVFLRTTTVCGPPLRAEADVICPVFEPGTPIPEIDTGQALFRVT